VSSLSGQRLVTRSKELLVVVTEYCG